MKKQVIKLALSKMNVIKVGDKNVKADKLVIIK